MPSQNSKLLLERARELRRNMTPQERKLWYLFLRPYPVKIYKQRILHGFIADFYCHAAKLVIEVDGSQHYTEEGAEYDQQRSSVFAADQIEVIRFSNREVNREFRGVCEAIHIKIRQRMGK